MQGQVLACNNYCTTKLTTYLQPFPGAMSDTTTRKYNKPCIGLRREDKNRWERRAPLSPSHVAELVKRGITVLVQPSNLRTYNDKTYREVCFLLFFPPEKYEMIVDDIDLRYYRRELSLKTTCRKQISFFV